MSPVRKFIAERMKIATDALIEEDGDKLKQTYEFMRALSDFGPEFLSGDFTTVVNKDGAIHIIYRPN